MRGTRILKISCVWMLVVTLITTAVASVGTSYARYSYTGEHQVVMYTPEEAPHIKSNIMLAEECTVVLKDWDINKDYRAQNLDLLLTGAELNGILEYHIPREYEDLFSFSVMTSDEIYVDSGREISVDGPTVLDITIEPVKAHLEALEKAISPEIALTFTELVETETGETVNGEKLMGTLKWNITPLDEPVPLPTKPALPTATATEIANEKLTFAMNFKADEVTEEQLAYYGSWYTDYEIKLNKDVTFNNSGKADGWLAGKLDMYRDKWITIPPFEDLTIKAGEPFRIMEYAGGKLINKPSHRYTYREIYEGIKDFNCGVYFDEEFLKANPDLEVTLELRMYNPADETESYVIGETYTFKFEKPEGPTATATEIANEELTFAMNFKADEASGLQLAYYGDWYADYEIKLNKDVTFNNSGKADGWLAGKLDMYRDKWITIPPFEDLAIKAGESFRIMEYAGGKLINKPSHRYTYREIYEGIKDFNCGVYFDEEFLKANPDLEVTLELRMYNPADETESYVIGETYTFRIEKPEVPTATATEIANEELTFAMNFKADEASALQLVYYGDWYTDYEIKLNKDVTFNNSGKADGWLAGKLDMYRDKWITIPPFEDLAIKAGESFRIMEYAGGELINKPSHRYTYREVYEGIKDFNCGVYFDEEFLKANPDLEVTLELRMYNPADETESYVIGETYTFLAPEPAKEEETPEVVLIPEDKEMQACEICLSTEHTADFHSEEAESTEEPKTDTEPMGLNGNSVLAKWRLRPLTLGADTITEPEPTPAPTMVPVPYKANASHTAVLENGDIVVYTYVTYPAETSQVEIADYEISEEGSGSEYTYKLTPYTQIHTEDGIYIMPYGDSFCIETNPEKEGSFGIKIVTPANAALAEEGEEGKNEGDTSVPVPTPTPENKVYTTKYVRWGFTSGTYSYSRDEMLCQRVEGTDFGSKAPHTEILSAVDDIVIKAIPVAEEKRKCVIEFYDNGNYVPVSTGKFKVSVNRGTNKINISVGDSSYPQAGIYRVCLYLQADNNLSTYYKTFFVNYR